MSQTARRALQFAMATLTTGALVWVSSCDTYGTRGGPGPDQQRHALRVQASGSGSGSVTAPDASPELRCTITSGALSGVCAGAYPASSTLRLVATPNAGSTFAGWSGGCAGPDHCVLDMSQERTVTAAFLPTAR